MKKRPKKPKIITLAIIIILAVVFGVQIYFTWKYTIPLRRSQEEDKIKAVQLEQRIAELEYMLNNTDDPDVIRRIAEELLGLVSPDEIIITGGRVID